MSAPARAALVPPSTKTDRLFNYAVVTASTLKDFADSTSTPFLRTISAVSLSILRIAESVKNNRDECIRLVSQIDELLAVILRICVGSESHESQAIAPTMLNNLGNFAATLQKIHSFVELQQNTSLIKRFFRQGENTALLEACRSGLSHAVDVFGVQTSLQASADMAEIRCQAETRHKELMQLFEGSEAPTGSDLLSLTSKKANLVGMGNSSTSFALLPASPQIFHGRERELHDIVSLLLQDPARVAVLGPGGIGKTSLCLAALHHPDIAAKYTHRHFVSCESATTLDGLLSIIAGCLGLSLAGNLSKQILQQLNGSPPCILALDNLESTWEPLNSRNQVDDFLSLLVDISHVALLITMRGAERPGAGRIRWTRPFIPPLEPLSDEAAQRIFLDITDDEYDDEKHMQELLRFTNNVPLAVTLVANIATFEGNEMLLLRWKAEKTRLFSDGPDKRSNLDLSIQISLSSPRMVDSPGGLQLLSLLSLLPDGISDPDLLASNFPIPEIGRSKATLVRTSLAYIGHDQRLRVLVPIREYIQNHNPPS
ncbi:P-loop containing nucleoside triphosphate hydrolase protein, partial [Mycena amicta]